MMNLGTLKKIEIISTTNTLVDYSGLDEDIKIMVIQDLLEVLNSFDFTSSPRLYISSYEAERGPTRELRITTDITMDIINIHVDALIAHMNQSIASAYTDIV